MLAIETSSDVGSVALGRGDATRAVRQLSAARRHTAELMPTIRDMLTEAGCRAGDLGVFAYSAGPGSFTGLRIAATVGRMLQSATGCEVIAVPTMEVIARNALDHPQRPTRLAVILDAKPEHVFGAVFERHGEAELRQTAAPALRLVAPWLASIPQPFWALGPGLRRQRESCAAAGGQVLAEDYWTPTAATVIAIARRMAAAGQFCRPEEIVPHYLRPPECEEVYEKRRAAARQRRGE
ncbi:MAG: tRNA (adenosine(37)-N6)-threonylcarbamoyltransferase complex dimerization subunit type 1 TsaB [Planctomycetes bacterium]|nr:tRNA (adenosine(37)-N6)-threonylcarbamoyltransferase complex dimerization subunit type 1 TsaB [Planctomycetota bacterium]